MIRENFVYLEGNLGADPEMHYFQDGTAACRLRIATNKFWRDEDGNDHKPTEWHQCVAYRKVAEMLGNHEGYKKGARVKVEGELHTRRWEDNEGITRYATEVILTAFPRLALGQPNGNRQPVPDMPPEMPPEMANQVGDEPAPTSADEIPF